METGTVKTLVVLIGGGVMSWGHNANSDFLDFQGKFNRFKGLNDSQSLESIKEI